MSTATCIAMLPAIGAKVRVRFESLHVECTVRDVKNSYGKPRLLIVPAMGSGEQWVELSRIVNATGSTVKFDCCRGQSFHSSNCPMVR
jgi:hypothetical protein